MALQLGALGTGRRLAVPFGFSDVGVRCAQCGHFLNVMAQAIPALPDPMLVTCPYCNHTGLYPKSAITSVLPRTSPLAPVLLGALVLVVVLVLAARWHW